MAVAGGAVTVIAAPRPGEAVIAANAQWVQALASQSLRATLAATIVRVPEAWLPAPSASLAVCDRPVPPAGDTAGCQVAVAGRGSRVGPIRTAASASRAAWSERRPGCTSVASSSSESTMRGPERLK
jgi:hypothetical protein